MAPDEFGEDLADRLRVSDEIALHDFADLVGMGREVILDDRLGLGTLILGRRV